jgi:hypothetical protein
MIDDLQPADKIALLSLVVSLVALGLAGYAIYRSNRNTSSATLVTLNVAFRDGWFRYLNAEEGVNKQFELAELLNLVETTCAICQENSLAGNSRKLMQAYLNTILKLLVKDEEVGEYVYSSLLEDDKTFQHIQNFIKHKPPYLSVTIPTKWYQKR